MKVFRSLKHCKNNNIPQINFSKIQESQMFLPPDIGCTDCKIGDTVIIFNSHPLVNLNGSYTGHGKYGLLPSGTTLCLVQE